ncbi:acyltransferase family protein [Janibacter sp. GXQ6167]|uniref:acyltransferase family protein n=1 Tax=Janibacter sp. GXQ6167 TaxID=3240791 RepID=UPI003524E247
MSERDQPPPAAGVTARFRPDIEGLRAVAVGLVLWYHASLPGLSGGFAGVDVFFVISGFLITGLLLREVERDGKISIPRFYARRAKRLFPAAATVLVSTAILIVAVFPRAAWRELGGDIAASAAYLINWRLANRSVDYLAEDFASSPVQHFWSLAVEEQYYIIWPLLIVVIAWLIRRKGLPVRPTLAIALGALVALPSLAWSIHLTSVAAPRAYFVTTTRLWELAIGALVAIGSVLWVKLGPRVAMMIGWVGLATIGIGAIVQSTTTPWPGSAALVPTLGTAAVIIGGFRAGSWGPVALLGRRFMTWIGSLSYSLYLWHWPLVVAAQTVWGGRRAAALAVAVSIIPSWLTYTAIENPVRQARRFSVRARPALILGAGLTALGIVVGLGLGHATPSVRLADPATAPGARILGLTTADPGKVTMAATAVTPDPAKATADVPSAYSQNCQVQMVEDTVRSCEFGDLDATRTIALVGDSKALQWLPALDDYGRREGWRVVIWIRSACAFSPALQVRDDEPDGLCHRWNEAVITRLTGSDRADIVIVSAVASRALNESGQPSRTALARGYVTYWKRLTDAGSQVVVITDNPHPGSKVYECVGDHADDYMTACAFTPRQGAGTPPLLQAAKQTDTPVIDPSPWLCPGHGSSRRCWPVIGEVLIYRQGSHLTKTYVETMEPILAAKLDAILAKGESAR